MAARCTICYDARRPAIDAALAAGAEPVRRIAARFKTTESTLRRHRPHVGLDVTQMVAAERRRKMERATEDLVEAASVAVKTLVDVAEDTNASPSARVAAARGILEHGLSRASAEDIEHRLADLEKQKDAEPPKTPPYLHEVQR
jgi:hypothetical protein